MAALRNMLFLCFSIILFLFLACVIVVVAGKLGLRTHNYRDNLGLLTVESFNSHPVSVVITESVLSLVMEDSIV